MKHLSYPLVTLFVFLFCIHQAVAQPLLRVGVAGLSHDHVHNVMHQYKNGQVMIVGIAEADTKLVQRYKRSYQLPDSLFYPSLTALLRHVHPDAVLAYNAINEHLSVVEACAPEGIAVMVEKPLATTVKDADRIAALADRYHIPVLTNYETTWYDTNQQLFDMVSNQHTIGEVRKMVVHDGHQGPKEIGCSADFLNWLTDPVRNGGGALRDFGCYGANLMTWLMQGKAPIAVTAVTRQLKPAVYPKVDDDAVILLEYPGATGVIEASWNWPFSIKDWEVYGTGGELHALNPKDLRLRVKDKSEEVPVRAAVYRDNITYLADVLNGKIDAAGKDLSSLSNNLIVVKILEAASRSAREGKRIVL
ncbi:MAG TPA: Gfo/Idh/MocA family oxidoreductase [Chitinophaga sp.]|uniref:Gfo/Idh/MocA family protein n=1 Tax=Chitinophaga sp. TaxID=1869181 RepID=UPI002CC09378|nr:Gfo/Idh/MocA family oxidoreductase [Chitinophaga sp.]HVI47257.1 Gfo/Idh/MocA family oxidoreductase [Chitinophaga sp.]